MSLPDYLLDLTEKDCDECGECFEGGGRLCPECYAALMDLYADAAYQDATEGR